MSVMRRASRDLARALFKLDDATITYHLLERIYADWANATDEALTSIAQQLEELKTKIQYMLNHPLRERFFKVADMQNTPYLLLGDIIDKNPSALEDLTEHSEKYEAAIREAYKARNTRLRGRIGRAALYSTLSIFVTKILFALLIEVPVDQFFNQQINYLPVLISVGVPPLLMVLLVTRVQTTTDQNLQKVIMEVMRLTYGSERKETQEISLPKKGSPTVRTTINLFYGLSFLLTFGLMVWILLQLHFEYLSIGIFTIFISLVAFAGTKIRQRARELMIEEQKGSPLYTILDIFSLPILQVGKWLSGQIARYNIIILLFNFLIEAPFQVFVEFLEQWRGFLREQKEIIH